MSELDKLEEYLKNNNYKYTRIDDEGTLFGDVRIGERHQIIVYDNDGNREWDAICHFGSYGYWKGLIEVMGNIVECDGDVEGHLSAEDIIERLDISNARK